MVQMKFVTMSLEQYNSLIGGMLNQWCALAKLRAEIEGKKERICWDVKGLGIWSVTVGIKKKKRRIG